MLYEIKCRVEELENIIAFKHYARISIKQLANHVLIGDDL